MRPEPAHRAIAAARSAAVRALCTALAAAMWTTGVSADSIFTKDGVEIPDVSFQFVRQGSVYYMADGHVDNTPIGEIARLQFDGLHQLDDAERQLTRGDFEDALDDLLAAIARADTETQRLWLHRRLAQVHDRLGDFLEAASHVGAVVTIDPSPRWISLAPESDVNEPTWYSAAEARYHLTRAMRVAEDQSLRNMLDDLLASVEPMYDVVREQNPRLEYRANSTVSGIRTQDLGGGWVANRGERTHPARATEDASQPMRDDAAQSGGDTGATEPQSTTNPPPDRPVRSGVGPGAIDDLLAAGRYDDALTICEQLRADPGERDLAEYLYQFGRALVGIGRHRDAAVRFMQCVSHFRGSRFATQAIIDTAIIYRDVYDRPDTARRLAEAGLADARALEMTADVERAEAVLATLAD